MFTLPSTGKSTLKSIVNLISLKLKLELTDPLYCEPSMQNHVYNAIKMLYDACWTFHTLLHLFVPLRVEGKTGTNKLIDYYPSWQKAT